MKTLISAVAALVLSTTCSTLALAQQWDSWDGGRGQVYGDQDDDREFRGYDDNRYGGPRVIGASTKTTTAATIRVTTAGPTSATGATNAMMIGAISTTTAPMIVMAMAPGMPRRSWMKSSS